MVNTLLRRILVLVLLSALPLLAAGTTALAHTEMNRSDPPEGAVLDRSPERVTIGFDEPVRREFISLVVRDSRGVQVDLGNGDVDPQDPTAIWVALPALPESWYTVMYQVVSADGHPARGILGFGVGTAAPPEPTGPVAQPTAWAQATAAAARGVDLGATLALVGLAAFAFLVWRPVSGAIPGVPPEPAPAFSRVARALFLLAVGAAGVHLVAYTEQAAGAMGVNLVLRAAFMTQTGQLTLLRLLLAAATWFLMDRARRPGAGKWAEPGALAVGAAALLLFSLNSHAAAEQFRNSLAVPADWLHLLAAAVWVGGLVAFARPVSQTLAALDPGARAARLGDLVRRFSVLATAGMALVVLTGVFAARQYIPSWEGLFTTAYGGALLAKVGLLLPLLWLGFVNQRTFARPGSRGDPRRFRTLVTAEVALVAVLFLAAGVLSSVAPARFALANRPFVAEQQADGLRIRLRLDPARRGFNTAAVTVLDTAGRPVDGAWVELDVSMAAHIHDQQAPVGAAAGSGRYQFKRVILTMGGEWSVAVVVLREQGGETRASFPVSVP